MSVTRRILAFVLVLGGMTAANGQTTISLTAQLNGANELPPNDSPLVATANLTLGSPFYAPGVSNVLAGYVATPFYPIYPIIIPFSAGLADTSDPELQIGTITFQDEAGNTITNLAPRGYTPIVILPAPIFIFSGFLVAQFIQPVVLTPAQVSDLLAGRWFIHAGAVTAAGEDYPQGAIRGRILPVDSDGDGVPDYLDECPGTPAGVAVDAHGCSIEQLCPCAGQWKNHGEYVNCITKATASFQREGLIAAAAARTIVQTAASSDCGKQLTPAAPFSGITGQSVMALFFLSYIMPDGLLGCWECYPIYVPFPTSIKVFSASDGRVTELTTDAQGQFQVHLKPGAYRLIPWVPNPPPPSPPWYFYISPCAAPVDVTVPFKQFTNVVVYYGYCFGQ